MLWHVGFEIPFSAECGLNSSMPLSDIGIIVSRKVENYSFYSSIFIIIFSLVTLCTNFYTNVGDTDLMFR